MVGAYYRHAPEVTAKLAVDSRLRGQARGLLQRLRPQLAEAVETGAFRLDGPTRNALIGFAEALQRTASPALEADLAKFLAIVRESTP
jgi:hypothetical protein